MKLAYIVLLVNFVNGLPPANIGQEGNQGINGGRYTVISTSGDWKLGSQSESMTLLVTSSLQNPGAILNPVNKLTFLLFGLNMLALV